MAYLLSKPRNSKPPAQTKLCLHCNQSKPTAKYYANRNWVENGKKDAWCKECVAKIRTKDEMRRYFWENNRMWKENVWETALKQAEIEATKSTVYQKSNEDRRKVLLEAIACPIMPTLMQMTQNYKFEDHSKDVNVHDYDEAKESGKIVEFDSSRVKDKDVKVYNEFFNGEFKPAEIEHLERYYERLGEGFNFSTDFTLEDNAKKLAKQSFIVDKMQNDFLAGRCSAQDVKDAMTLYDMLLKTGNFAACKRKPDEKSGLSSFAEITQYCETHGYPCVKKIDWPKDVVDTALDGLSYIIESMRDEEMSDVT